MNGRTATEGWKPGITLYSTALMVKLKIVNKWWCAYIRHHSFSACCWKWNWQRLKSNQWHQRYWWTAICNFA